MKFVRLLPPLNTLSGKAVTPDPRTTLSRLNAFANAPMPSDVTLSGTTTSRRTPFMDLANAASPIVSMPSCSTSRPSASSHGMKSCMKAMSPIVLTEPAISTSYRYGFIMNAPLEMLTGPDGIVSLLRPTQFIMLCGPISRTEAGMVMSTKLSQREHEASPSSVTLTSPVK